MVLLPQIYTQLNCINQWLPCLMQNIKKGNCLGTSDKPLLGLPKKLSSQDSKHALTISVYILNAVATLLGSLSI